MTIQGAIAELQNLLEADDVPFYYKGGIEKVIETIQMEMADRKTEPTMDEALVISFGSDVEKYHQAKRKVEDEPTISKMEQVEYEPQMQLTAKCLECNNSKACKENNWQDCRYEPLGYEVTAVVGTIKDEPQLTPNYCGTCKHREVPCGDLPCDVCHSYSRYEPNDELQTERSE